MLSIQRIAFGVALLLVAAISPCLGKEYIRVPAQQEACFIEHLNVDEVVVVAFQVIKGGYLDVDTKVLDKDNQVVHESFRQTEGRFKIKAESNGKHTICFGNTMSTMTAKDINISIHSENDSELLDDVVAEKQHLQPIESLVNELSVKIAELQEEELFLRRLGHRHDDTTRSTSIRVLLSTIFEAVVLLGINFWQIYYLRQFFEVKRRI